jgi:hypothetical protein
MIMVDVTTGCWLWQGKPTTTGYGQTYRDGKNQKAHRYVYEQVKGAIKPGYQLHHTCKNRLCVNPDHMEEIFPSEHGKLHTNDRTYYCPTCALPKFICDVMVASGKGYGNSLTAP